MIDRFMRVMVFFDLPTSTAEHRREYTQFRKFLINDGYTMLQFSVYSRTVRNNDDAKAHLRRVERNLPPEGSVRALIVTEKQYAGMRLLLGDAYADEKYVDAKDFIEL